MEAKTTEWRPGPTVCRCCLTEGCYKDISTEYFWMGKREVYSEMLSETLDLNIAYSQSGGPNSNSRLICEPCISRLRDATDFKRQVLECERSFMQYLDPVGSGDIGVSLELDKDVKIERVKDEKTLLDDDDDEFVPPEFGDEDDDDLDDQPLTKLASKIPKKESVDVLDLLDNAKITEKRKSSSKSKSSPAKKSKLKKEVASSSKVKPEPRKKKGSASADMPNIVGVKPVRKLKENVCARQMRRRRRANNEFPEESDKRIAKTMMRRNAITLLECSTAWAFRWFQSAFYCSYCDEKFIEPLNLRKHVRTLHLNHAPTKHIFSKLTENNMVKIDVSDLHCRLCNSKIESIDILKKHLMTNHDKKIYTNFNDGVLPFKLDENRFNCQKCSLIFTSFSKINEHMNTHYQNYVCDTCGKAFVSKSRFRTHVQSHEIGSFPCGECDEVLDTRAARMCHKLKIHRNGIRYTCPRCPEVFTTYYARAKHLVDGHDQQKVDYQCSSCGKIFETSCKRTAHIRMTHTATENKFRCPNCSWYFVSKSKLKRHISTHDTYENINDFSINKQNRI